MNYFILFPLLVSFLITLFLTPLWIRKAHGISLVWDDMNKLSARKVAGSGGIISVLGFIIGVLLYVAYKVFILKNSLFLIEIFALLTVILFLGAIGFVDDLLGWRKGGLSKRSRIVMCAFSAIPLMVINAGKSVVNIPLLGNVDLGYFYPLLIIPIGIVGATTTFNFLAGFNGLEAGQGVILISALSYVSYLTGYPWLAFIGFCMVFSLLAFLFYNIDPAKVFPGDSLTYSIGGLIAIIAILGNFEKIAVFFFIPYAIETILKLRGGLTKQSFGMPQKDGSLDLRYEKMYGLEHVSIKVMKNLGIMPTEKKVVLSIWAFQIFIILIGFALFREGIFING